MRSMPLTREAQGLAREVLDVSIGQYAQDVFTDERTEITFNLVGRSGQTMTAIYVLLDQGALYPAQILLRHLFELAVTVCYLNKHPDQISSFACYSRRPGQTKAWRPISELCQGVGLLNLYKTLYRQLSEKAHAGVFSMAREHAILLGDAKREDYEFASSLLNAMLCYSWALEVREKLFPNERPTFVFDGWLERVLTLYDNVLKAHRADLPASKQEGQ